MYYSQERKRHWENSDDNDEDDDSDPSGFVVDRMPTVPNTLPPRRPMVLVLLLSLSLFLHGLFLGSSIPNDDCWTRTVVVRGIPKEETTPYYDDPTTHSKRVPDTTTTTQRSYYYTCPSSSSTDTEQQLPQIHYADNMDVYLDPIRNISHHFETFVQHYRDYEFDDWGVTYRDFAHGRTAWKSTMYTPYLQSGNVIYESASGIGMNLLVTLEILQQHNITNISYFGNEYLQPSVALANRFLPRIAPQPQPPICHCDSTNLSHIPNNTFDLVFTGYISTLRDPLGWYSDIVTLLQSKHNKHNTNNVSSTVPPPHPTPHEIEQALDARYMTLCKSTDWKSRTLLQVAQERQNNYHAQWILEMIRIVKDGQPIIVESITGWECQQNPNVFGLLPSWWSTAIGQYEWPVDPTSLTVQNDTVIPNRYHVFLKKKRTKKKPASNRH